MTVNKSGLCYLHHSTQQASIFSKVFHLERLEKVTNKSKNCISWTFGPLFENMHGWKPHNWNPFYFDEWLKNSNHNFWPALLTELGFLLLTLILGWGSNRPSSAGELWRQSDCGTWIPSMQLKFLWQSRSNCFKEMEPTTFPIFYLVDTILILYSQMTMVVDLKV